MPHRRLTVMADRWFADVDLEQLLEKLGGDSVIRGKCKTKVWLAGQSSNLQELLNWDFDGKSLEPDYGGYNPDAILYWRTQLKMQSITPTLAYPVMPNRIASSIQ